MKIMDYRVILLCVVTVYGGVHDQNRYYKTQIGTKSDSTANSGGVKQDANQQLLDFSSRADEPFFESAASEVGQLPPKNYAHPVYFATSFNSDGSKKNADKILKYLNPTSDEATKRTEDFASKGMESYVSPTALRASRHHKKSKLHGKPSYPSNEGARRRSEPSAVEYYTDLYSKHKDVEMILPKEKSIILPMVNGKPKPYQGYRAASDVKTYLAESEGDIIYGKPSEDAYPKPPYRIKRSPAEYHGAIYPHFDYSDPENIGRVIKDHKADKSYHLKRKGYPKKHISEKTDKPHNLYKYPKAKKTNKRSSDEHDDDEEEEQAEEDEHQLPAYKYKYDSSFNIPPLEIKYYPYERHGKKKQQDNKEAGSEDDERYESSVDEYTAEYEKYKQSLPTDLESYFGKPDFGDFSVEATENLENNKNCEKIIRQDDAENSTDSSVGKGTQVCYVCQDPKTGGNYEQCAYRTEPKSEKYFYGGSSTYKSDESPELINYRYRRSTFGDGFDLDSFVFGGNSNVKRKVRQNPDKFRKNRHWKSWESEDKNKYRMEDHYGSPSARRNKKSKGKEEPPESYNGPRYTYEGPKHPYEGPAETYEGPIDKDYYITSDDRIENDEGKQLRDGSQNQPKKDYYEYNSYHPADRRYSPSAHRKSTAEPESEVEELEEHSYGHGYMDDYRFGPEHFIDDEEVEEERPKERQKSESKPRPVERRHKHSGSESSPASTTDEEERETGSVKVFKNGDVCRKKKVNGMICMVCQNEKTGATYEQCQYSSKPKDKYYAYGSQKSYRTSDPKSERNSRKEEADQYPEKSDVIEKKILITKQSKVFQDNSGPLDTLPNVATIHGDLLGSPSDNLETHFYDPDNNGTHNRQVSESIMRIEPRDGIEGLEEYLYSDNDRKATEEDREYSSYDEYFRDIFPEFANKKGREDSGESDEDDEAEESEESESETHVNFDPFSDIRNFKKNSPSFLEEYSVDDAEEDTSSSADASSHEPLRLNDRKSRLPSDFFTDEGEDYHEKDIEKALGEFQNRDWSNCKKIVKDKLTCYQCIDKNGVNNEECMYVEASQPINKQLAYHEKKELMPETLETKQEEKPASPEQNNTGKENKQTQIIKTPRRMRRPKNAKEVNRDAAVPQETTNRQRPIGDFEGIERVPAEVLSPAPPAATEAAAEDSTVKPRTGSPTRRNQKRIKTLKQSVETTTESLRKRKYPVKKASKVGGTSVSTTENVLSEAQTTEISSEPDIK